MNTAILTTKKISSNISNTRDKDKIDYKRNLTKILGEDERDLKIIKNCFGILRGRLKKSAVVYQRLIRKEWER